MQNELGSKKFVVLSNSSVSCQHTKAKLDPAGTIKNKVIKNEKFFICFIAAFFLSQRGLHSRGYATSTSSTGNISVSGRTLIH